MRDYTQLRAMLIDSEGKVPHLYQDTVGCVTVGVGHMVPDVQAAQALTFNARGTSTPVAVSGIAAEFEAITVCQKGLAASSYQQHTTMEMPEDAIHALLDKDIAEVEAGVRSRFTGYDSYPEAAQLALLDMAFNLGVAGLATKFPKLRAAAEAGHWSECAAESHRTGISDARNEHTKQLFESASQPA